MGAVIGIVLSAVVIAILLAIFYASNKNADTSKEDDRSRKTANGTVKNKDIETYKEKPPTQKLSSLDHGTIKKPMSYAEYSELTGITINFPEKDVNGNPFDISDIDFSAMLDQSYPYNLKPQKSLSEKIIDEFDETVKKVLKVIDKDYFGEITFEYTLPPITSALVLSTFSTTIGCQLSVMGKSDERIESVLNKFWSSVEEYIQEQFSYLSRNKYVVFGSCYSAFCKIQGGLIEPRCLWTAPLGFKGLFALVAAFGDMLSSPDIATDYENGKPSDKIDFSIPSDKTVQFTEKVFDAIKPVFEGADAIIKILKAHEEEI